jgi:hypothetical protein
MLETGEERSERLQKNALITFFLIIIILIVSITIIGWERYGPLPNEKICDEKGFEGGKKMDGITICYNQCTTNKLESCNEMRVMGASR